MWLLMMMMGWSAYAHMSASEDGFQWSPYGDALVQEYITEIRDHWNEAKTHVDEESFDSSVKEKWEDWVSHSENEIDKIESDIRTRLKAKIENSTDYVRLNKIQVWGELDRVEMLGEAYLHFAESMIEKRDPPVKTTQIIKKMGGELPRSIPEAYLKAENQMEDLITLAYYHPKNSQARIEMKRLQRAWELSLSVIWGQLMWGAFKMPQWTSYPPILGHHLILLHMITFFHLGIYYGVSSGVKVYRSAMKGTCPALFQFSALKKGAS